jgi:hypothetical protein
MNAYVDLSKHWPGLSLIGLFGNWLMKHPSSVLSHCRIWIASADDNVIETGCISFIVSVYRSASPSTA